MRKMFKTNKQPFEGLTIVISGQCDWYKKEELRKLCLKLGSKSPTQVSGKTNYLLQGAYSVDKNGDK